jgi:hypothetical protein
VTQKRFQKAVLRLEGIETHDLEVRMVFAELAKSLETPSAD